MGLLGLNLVPEDRVFFVRVSRCDLVSVPFSLNCFELQRCHGGRNISAGCVTRSELLKENMEPSERCQIQSLPQNLYRIKDGFNFCLPVSPGGGWLNSIHGVTEHTRKNLKNAFQPIPD